MKKLLIIINLIVFSILANAQSKEEIKRAWSANTKRMEEMKTGKYIKTDAKKLFVGQWISDEAGKEIELLITTKKVHFKHGEYDYYVDAIYVEVKKYMYKGEDLTKRIKEPIMLTGDSFKYSSMFLKDPVSGDDINFKLYNLSNDGTLKLRVNTIYENSTSIFPLGDTKLKRKK